jgi:hypothetical protein
MCDRQTELETGLCRESSSYAVPAVVDKVHKIQPEQSFELEKTFFKLGFM